MYTYYMYIYIYMYAPVNHTPWAGSCGRRPGCPLKFAKGENDIMVQSTQRVVVSSPESIMGCHEAHSLGFASKLGGTKYCCKN